MPTKPTTSTTTKKHVKFRPSTNCFNHASLSNLLLLTSVGIWNIVVSQTTPGRTVKIRRTPKSTPLCSRLLCTFVSSCRNERTNERNVKTTKTTFIAFLMLVEVWSSTLHYLLWNRIDARLLLLKLLDICLFCSKNLIPL